MECSISISVDYDGSDYQKGKIVTARKKHTCCECGMCIQIGEQYEYVWSVSDGHQHSYHTCSDCKSIRDVFFHSWVYTEIWDNFHEEFGHLDIAVPESCISILTPGARAKICEMIEHSW